MTVPDKPALKSRESWRFIGKGLCLARHTGKDHGTGRYGIDDQDSGHEVPNIMQCPNFGVLRLRRGSAPAMAVAGVEHVVPMNRRRGSSRTAWDGRQGSMRSRPSESLTRRIARETRKTIALRLIESVSGNGTRSMRKGQPHRGAAAVHDAAMAKAKGTL